MSVRQRLPWLNEWGWFITYENSVVFVEDHFDSIAEYTGVGTGYSVMKFPWVSLTFLVTPRLMVCLRLHAVSTPLVVFDTIESGLSGASYREGSAGLKRFKV